MIENEGVALSANEVAPKKKFKMKKEHWFSMTTL